jgi:hypothetical protein
VIVQVLHDATDRDALLADVLLLFGCMPCMCPSGSFSCFFKADPPSWKSEGV